MAAANPCVVIDEKQVFCALDVQGMGRPVFLWGVLWLCGGGIRRKYGIVSLIGYNQYEYVILL